MDWAPVLGRKLDISHTQVIRISSAQRSQLLRSSGIFAGFRANKKRWSYAMETHSTTTPFHLCVDPIDQAEKVSDSWYVFRFIFLL